MDIFSTSGLFGHPPIHFSNYLHSMGNMWILNDYLDLWYWNMMKNNIVLGVKSTKLTEKEWNCYNNIIIILLKNLNLIPSNKLKTWTRTWSNFNSNLGSWNHCVFYFLFRDLKSDLMMICNLELHRLGVSFDQHGTNTFACANCFLAPIVSVLLSMVMSILPKWFRRERTPLVLLVIHTFCSGTRSSALY